MLMDWGTDEMATKKRLESESELVVWKSYSVESIKLEFRTCVGALET